MYKTCSICSIHKKLDDFHKLKKGKFGKNSQCKECRKIKKVQRIRKIQYKKIKCYCCKEIKNISEFYKNKSTIHGYQLYCKICHILKIKKSMSKIENFLKIILKKFIKRNKKKKIDINIFQLIQLYNRQNKKCYITNHDLTTIVDNKQRTDSIWNISLIIINENKNLIKIEDIRIVCNLISSSKYLYNLNYKQLKDIYKKINNT